MAISAVIITILVLVLLITWAKVQPFIAFVISSIIAAILLEIPLEQIPATLEMGLGNMLGSLTVIICFGAMFGKLVSETGAAKRISSALIDSFGERYITWALMLTGFVVGIPLFYNVGFVLLIPLVFSVAYQTKLPVVYLGIPLLAALSVTHGYLPPHPSPTALVSQFNADMGLTLLYGLVLAAFSMSLAGPIFAKRLKNMTSTPIKTFKPTELSDDQLPGKFTSFFIALLPVLMIAGTTVLPYIAGDNMALKSVFAFIGDPMIVMLIALSIATYVLGIARGYSMSKIMAMYSEAIKDIAVILLIVAGAGALKQVFVTSGVSAELGDILKDSAMNPLVLGWLIATIIRICLGSATVAGLTAAGIMAPVVIATGANPNLMVLAIGAGSLMCSHVNDSGFWMYKEYFNLSLADTFKSWSLMETIVGLTGLVGVLILDSIL